MDTRGKGGRENTEADKEFVTLSSNIAAAQEARSSDTPGRTSSPVAQVANLHRTRHE